MDRQTAIKHGYKTYQGKQCAHCGSTIRYVSSFGCKPCNVKRSLHNLYDDDLMAPYRSREKSNKRQRNWRKNNPEKAAAARNRQKDYMHEYYLKNKDRAYHRFLKNKYGISLDEYNEMLKEQNNSCYICGKHESEQKKRLNVDHNHQTGKVRALLCVTCNTSLGLMKEDLGVFKTMIKYVEEDR